MSARAHAQPWRTFRCLLVVIALCGAVADAARACDICAVYTATETGITTVGWHFGMAEQFTYFGTLQLDGEKVPNPENEHLDSSITQFLIGYNLIPRFGVQLAVPFITRSFRRLHDGESDKGDETGFGDLSLLMDALAFTHVDTESVAHLSLLAGVKLPSGSPDRLKEEMDQGDTDPPDPIMPRPNRALADGGAAHHSPTDEPSGIHGHDLTLGSGSVDGIVGGQLFASWQRVFFRGLVQYSIRGKGAFDYQFANDLVWIAGPGAFVLLNDAYSLSLQAVLSGETKGTDTQDGQHLDDSGITALYIGPGISFTWGSRLSAEIGADLPVIQNNTSLQIVPDYRIRGGLVWRLG